MTVKFPAGAGALGGLAAGLVLLGASSAPAAESAANYSTNTNASDTGGWRVVEGDGALKPMPASDLKALEWAAGFTPVKPDQVVRLPAAMGAAAAAWNAGNADPLTCMAEAVYFEARSESQVGQEAVAQVVMNRTKLPQYPATVCGVVFQGSDRTTGCQFTFVCDGTLHAPTDMEAWDRAVEVARKALAGYVCKPVGEATHYHAAWMTPYWAGSLTRIRQLGGQIFYH